MTKWAEIIKTSFVWQTFKLGGWWVGQGEGTEQKALIDIQHITGIIVIIPMFFVVAMCEKMTIQLWTVYFCLNADCARHMEIQFDCLIETQ